MLSLCKLRQTLSLNKLSGIVKLYPKPTSTPRLLKRTYASNVDVNPKYENRVRLKDRVSKDYRLVYYSKATIYFNSSYHAAYLVALSSVGAFIYVLMGQPKQYPIVNEYFHVPHRNETEVLVLYAGLIVFNLFIFKVCRAHVARIWYNPKERKYLLVSCNGLPGRFMNKLQCNPGDATRKYPNIHNWLAEALHSVNGKTRHFTDAKFQCPADYHRLVGTIE